VPKFLTFTPHSISGKFGIISEKANNINRINTTINKVANQISSFQLNLIGVKQSNFFTGVTKNVLTKNDHSNQAV
jgi:hypothetical protein